MNQATLVGPDIEGGREFLELLEQSKVAVTVALWQSSELPGNWSLVLATPLVDQIGLKETYRRILNALSKARPRPPVDLLNVSILAPEGRFMKDLRRELRHKRNLAIHGRAVGDHVIDNGYIYFVK